MSSFTTVRFIAEPGLPSHRMDVVRRALEDALSLEDPGESDATTIDWLPLSEQTPLSDEVVQTFSIGTDGEESSTLTVLLTDMPRWSEGRLVIGEGHPDSGVVVVSFPGLGARVTSRRIAQIAMLCLRGHLDREEPRPARGWHVSAQDDVVLVRRNRVSSPWIAMLGMIRTNQPWKLISQLKGATATGLATSAFGVFYTSVWQMADQMSTIRLVLIPVLAVCALAWWLSVGYGLQGPRSVRRGRSPGVRTVWTMSTTVTLLFTIGVLYVYLFVLVLAMAALVISPGMMESVIGHPPDVYDYLKLAIFSAALGIVAGSVGTGLDSNSASDQLTHQQRAGKRIDRGRSS